MLIRGIRSLIFALVCVVLFISVPIIFYTREHIALSLHGSRARADISNSGHARDETVDGEEQQTPFSATTSQEHDGYAADVYNEIFSLSTPDGKYFTIDFSGEGAMNPSIIPHPSLPETWIIVAQTGRNATDSSRSTWFSELVCSAVFNESGDRLACVHPPKILSIGATAGDKCVGDLDYFALNIGPHDARVFYGPEAPYAVFGSNSQHTCFGQWVQGFRSLVDWAVLEGSGDAVAVDEFRLATELQRPGGVYSPVEKNWFLFWDAEGQMYVHYDISPERVFARLSLDGSVGQDLAPLAASSDGECMAKYMPSLINPHHESIHQATNSLSVTMCHRAESSCDITDENTFIFTLFQHKAFYAYHSVYEPYVMLFRRTAPFEVYAISKRPIWIHGRGRAGEAPRPTGEEYDRLEQWEQSEMLYVTSMSWRERGMNYHGYVDDVLFIAFGVEDRASGGIDVAVGDLFRELGVCGEG